jgi:hypothetical protein
MADLLTSKIGSMCSGFMPNSLSSSVRDLPVTQPYFVEVEAAKSARVMAARSFFVEISRTATAVNRRQRTPAGVGVLHGSRACVFLQRSIGVAGRARGLRDNEDSENQESQNRDQNKIPAPEFCGSPRRRRSQTPLKRAILAPMYSEFPFVRPGLHKSSSTAAFQPLSESRLLIKTYRITIWLQGAKQSSALRRIQWTAASRSAVTAEKKSRSETGVMGLQCYACGRTCPPELRLLPLEAL